jgi:hypothetical protein
MKKGAYSVVAAPDWLDGDGVNTWASLPWLKTDPNSPR